jgi:GntR family transcriptional regulator, transcriptional repressor for pyruvate dehydrogenase complex
VHNLGLPGEAIEKIKEMILSGRLRPGDRLPPEQALAAELGMSRNMLREAVTALSLINVLDVRRGDGTYVTTLSPSLLLDALTFVSDFQRDDTVLNFIEVRKLLEPAATARAATLIADDELAGLAELLDTMREDIPVDDLVQKDAEFHRRIIAAAGNPILESVLETMSRPLHRARVWREVLEHGAFDRTRKEHLAILDALRRNDAEDARAWTQVHISATEQWLRSRVAASPGTDLANLRGPND